ncbi:DUF1800 domain-containing protein [Terrarubrum flagellatum]|uniref:DUF1800 domain-containing protein n=1 Tax=Terrirubrum flagellatum TaxID=2895980 RepID=UPI003144EACD
MADRNSDARSIAALQRFGFGPRPGDLAALGGDALDAMRQIVRAKAVAEPTGDHLVSTPQALRELDEFRTEVQRKRAAAVALEEARQQQQAMQPPVGQPGQKVASIATPVPAINKPPPMAQIPQLIFRNEADARFRCAVEAQTGFAERLVWFWSNHFCVAVSKGQPNRVTAGSFEREAIRPHVFGKFADMLLAVEKHPAMLIYLDNRQSVGANSRAGARRGRGLNENLAREIMELHTLGVGGGYSQTDVTTLAKIITGWTVINQFDEDGELGEFRFNGNRHEPGDQTLLGKTYRDEGVKQGEKALIDIARHPSTALFIARKLARHFVADDPPQSLVDRLARTFRDTQGDLAAVSLALLDSKEALETPPMKLRSPQEFVVAAVRATGRKFDIGQALNVSRLMGHDLWNPSGPNGFGDAEAQWATPDGMKVRLDFASAIARQTPGSLNPSELLEQTIGPIVSTETRQAVARAESRPQGIALMLMSPEFQRR